VQDQGPGITAERQDTIFELFERGGDTPGFGVGLWVSRQLARAMHGDLRVEFSSPGGSGFMLCLPIDAGHTPT
jgi:signal transduction histidine kinase